MKLENIEYRMYDSRTNSFHYWDAKTNKYGGIFWDMVGLEETSTPEQFTGVYDWLIEGVKVWESDIIKNRDNGELQVVFWNEGVAAWYCRYIYDKTRIVSLADSLGNLNEVFGNIHENPELLKQS